MDNLLKQLNTLETVPADALKDITDRPEVQPEVQPEDDLSGLADHTENNGGDYEGTFPDHNAPDNNTNARPRPSSGGSFTAGQLIPAPLAVRLVDLIVPAIIVIAMKKISGRTHDKNIFKANKEERELIEPVLQNWLDSIAVDIDKPFNALLVVLGCVYGTKIVELSTGTVQTPNRVIKEVLIPVNEHSRRRPGETRGRKAGTKAGRDFKPRR